MKNEKVLLILALSISLAIAACDKGRPQSQNSSPAIETPKNSMILEGTINGGGGKGILCNDGRSETLEVLDLYEARAYGLDLVATPQSDEAAIELVAEKLATQLWNPDTFEIKIYQKKLVQELKEKWLKKIRFLKAPRELQIINDSHEVIIEKNCRPVQIAVYYESALLVNEALWKKLSYLNRAALWLHEILYFIERSNGHTNSISTRLLVGQLLSTKGSVPRGEGVPLDSQLRRQCSLKDGKLEAGYLYAYETTKDDRKGVLFNFNYLKNSTSIMKTTAFFSDLELASLFPVEGESRTRDAQLEIEGLVEHRMLTLQIQNKELKLTLSDNKANVITDLSMSCSRPYTPETPPLFGSNSKLTPEPAKIPDEVELLSRYVEGGSYSKTATYSFRYMTHDEELTRNNWDVLFEARHDFPIDHFDVNTVTDDDSYIFALESGQSGCLEVDPCELQKLRLYAKENTGVSRENRKFDRADVKTGQCYLDISRDHNGSIAALFAVKSALKSTRAVIHQIKVLPEAFELNPKCEK